MSDLTQLIVATPIRSGEARTGQVSVGYMEFVHYMQSKGAGYYGGALTYGCDVVRGRNRIAAKVLREAPSATHVLWVDDDNWPEDPTLVERMLALGEDVVGVPYTNKRPPLRWVFQPRDQQEPEDDRGVMYVRGVGFGFTLTSTRCLRRMSDVTRQYTDQDGETRVSNMFGLEYDTYNGQTYLLSEDYSFCKVWRDMNDKLDTVALFTRGVIYHSGAHAWSARDMMPEVGP